MLIRKISLSLIIFFCLFPSSISLAQGEPEIVGRAAVLIDSKSGKIIYAKNSNLPLQPASTTKILTAIIALEKCQLSELVKAGKTPSLVQPAAIGLKEGETISMENLLYSLLVKSANDAAVAIAEHISGSVPEFTKLMNIRARELGATNSSFVNPHGLTDPNQYTTAHDLAVIAKYAMENAEFRKFVSTKYKVIPRADDSAVKWLQNHNKMLSRYNGANGIKTGYTKAAKQCLVASAARGDQEFIAVILGSEGSNVWTDAEYLLDYGFANFVTYKQKNAHVPVKTVSVTKGMKDVALITEKDFFYTCPRGTKGKISEQVEINTGIIAPVKKGEILGKVRFVLSGTELGWVNLVAEDNVPVRRGVTKNITPSLNPVLAGMLVVGLYMAWTVRKRRRKLKKRNRLRYNWKNPVK